MSELTLIFDCDNHKELKEYLVSLNGILEVEITNIDDLKIYVKYDSNLINLKTIKMEILLFLDVIKIPSIISFNKHSKNSLSKYTIIIENLCCEYCFKGMIEELLVTDGIESAYSDFDYDNKKNVAISICYDNNLIAGEVLKKIENKLNMHDFS